MAGNGQIRIHLHDAVVDEHRVGAAIRAVRQRKGWRQADLAERAGVSRWTVLRIERGRLGGVPFETLSRVAKAMDASLSLYVRWQGGDLDRLMNARHARMHESIARFFESMSEWLAEPEVSFSIWGERGVIDVLAWHQAGQALLVIELKTELVDINELLATFDRKRRLAVQVARQRTWRPTQVGCWLVLADSRTNRRVLAAHATALRSKLPANGRDVRRWLRQPDSDINGLGFLPDVPGVHLRQDMAPRRRVHNPATKRRRDPRARPELK